MRLDPIPHDPRGPAYPDTKKAWAAYLKENGWRCKRSPTGAHYFVGVGDSLTQMRCKLCKTRRNFKVVT